MKKTVSSLEERRSDEDWGQVKGGTGGDWKTKGVIRSRAMSMVVSEGSKLPMDTSFQVLDGGKPKVRRGGENPARKASQ